MIYGYARVSTKSQERDGNSLESQVEKLKENGATVVYTESFTGTKRHRPELDKLLSELKEGDVLVVTKLDRIARSVMHGAGLMEELVSKGVKVNVLNMGIMDNSPASKLMRSMFFAFAEFERDMIVERTREGKEVARRKPDYKEGRPQTVEISQEMIDNVEAGVLSIAKACRELGIPRSTWYNRMRTEGGRA